MKKNFFKFLIITLVIAVEIVLIIILNNITYGTSDRLIMILSGVCAFMIIMIVSIFGWWIDKGENL